MIKYLPILCFLIQASAVAQSVEEQVKYIVDKNWILVGKDSILQGSYPILEFSFENFEPLEDGKYKGWYYCKQGVISNKIVDNVREVYSGFEAVLKQDSLRINILSIHGSKGALDPFEIELKYNVDKTKKQISLILPDNRILIFRND